MRPLGFRISLILGCIWLISPLTLGAESQQGGIIDLDKVASDHFVLEFMGPKFRLGVFKINGGKVEFVQPQIAFRPSCDDGIRFNYLYRKYQLSIRMHVKANRLKYIKRNKASVGEVTLTELRVKTNEVLRESGYKVMAELMNTERAQLLILCSTYVQCQQLRDDVDTNPDTLARAVKFVPVGRVNGIPVKFGTIGSVNSPARVGCNPGRWVVFQRRVDGNLSFARNWDSYVRGFGNPSSNYWMGLDQLFAMTVTSRKNGSSRCQLRIETQDFNGKNYSGEYKSFEVLGPSDNYELQVGQMVSGSTMNMPWHNGMQFSTYDRDHDTRRGSCSQMFGYGGWWFKNCHYVNLNGAYTTDKNIAHHSKYVTIYMKKFIPMKKTLMKFKCN